MAQPTLHAISSEQTVSVNAGATVDQVITEVREFTPVDDGVSVYYVYVRNNGELVGVVSMRELLNAKGSDPVSEIMTVDLVTVTTSDSLQHAVHQFTANRFAVLPVVDESGQFSGVLRANDVIDALDEQTTKQILKQAGLCL
ncbi:CBS domain-containing protein [Natronococcus occultus]|uniref:Mg/Co/Ni transporter MgtE with CBS domain n=1 Tax=Natronococcus occultus SP4 TaxID=694430 RepID=L0JV79_9EURY|nr:CBS domain-containing protein [Natronococcus occultus]AGB36917.1 Mg/Co/Ni transporter MgtE with CBS domain [Natronococcus occultus SP4]